MWNAVFASLRDGDYDGLSEKRAASFSTASGRLKTVADKEMRGRGVVWGLIRNPH